MRLITKRLILRPLRKGDWRDIVEGVGDIKVSKNLLVVPHPYHKKNAMEWINEDIKKRKKGKYNFMIELKSEKKAIGTTRIDLKANYPGIATTGSWVNKKYWRKGYILEAKVAILDFAFKKLKLRKIETEAFVENVGSNKMSKKLGFKYEGRKRKAAQSKATGKIHDENIYGLLKKEWLQRRPKIIKAVNKKIKASANS